MSVFCFCMMLLENSLAPFSQLWKASEHKRAEFRASDFMCPFYKKVYVGGLSTAEEAEIPSAREFTRKFVNLRCLPFGLGKSVFHFQKKMRY